MHTITRLIICTLFFISSTFLQAQLKINDTSIYKVFYTWKHFYDTTDLTKVKVDTMVLNVGKEFSMFSFAGYEAFLARLEEQKKIMLTQLALGERNFILPPTLGRVSSAAKFKKNESNEIIDKSPLAGNTYLISDTISTIQWEINTETKKLGEFNCQKAVGKHKGRVYTAWFCPDLPVRTGPWSLGGLPGTILEATDSKNHVLFLYAGVEATGATVIALPVKYINASRKDFDKLLAAYAADPVQFINNNSNHGDGNVTVTIKLDPNSPLLRKNPINNPLILPDK